MGVVRRGRAYAAIFADYLESTLCWTAASLLFDRCTRDCDRSFAALDHGGGGRLHDFWHRSRARSPPSCIRLVADQPPPHHILLLGNVCDTFGRSAVVL